MKEQLGIIPLISICLFLVGGSAQSLASDCGTIKGIEIPCWDSYLESEAPWFEGSESLPYYPYAKRPNGCSIPGAKPGANDSINILNINISFRDICDKHDKCYYTLGTTPWECNKPFEERLRARCEREISNHAITGVDILTGGTSRASILATCYAKAESISLAVIGAQSDAHNNAQETQKKYNVRVKSYLQTMEERARIDSDYNFNSEFGRENDASTNLDDF